MPEKHPGVQFLINLSAVLLIVAGAVHWLIIFGVMHEHTPLLVAVYFHSLAVFDPLAAVGLFKRRNWGRLLAIALAALQLPAHGYMIYLDNFAGWTSGLSLPERMVDVVLSTVLIIVFSTKPFRRAFGRAAA